ncbi:centrosomal protein of 120 kDa [Anabrus simplex]|uniref:centrosomal protein of 120 kDa n=1 Tax=Anabrus simplex TaxID=316456 RepID=UPI0035A36482
MDALRGPNVHVILSLKEGRGFSFLEHSVMIEATLNGHVLGTHIIPPAEEFSISVELMWEVAKKALRRFRTGNVPVKVESFTIANQEKHERIGYLLLNLRSAQIAVSGRSFQISGTWHPLLGVKSDHASYRPELLLTVHVEDANPELLPVNVTRNGTNGTNVFSHARHVFTPQLFEDEGIIQLGPKDTANDVFMLTIFVGEAVNLHLLTDALQAPVGDFWFSCNIMGFTMRAGSLRNLSSFSANNNEKVIVRIRSSLKILRTFFTDVSVITMHFMHGQQEIAFVDVDITVLVPTSSISVFCSQHAVNNTMAHINRCYLVKSSSGDVPVGTDGSKPYIDVVMKLKYMGANGDNTRLGQGDVLCSAKSISDHSTAIVNSEGDLNDKRTATEALPDCCSLKNDSLEQIDPISAKYYLNLDIVVENILFYKIPPEKNVIFRFGKKKEGSLISTYHEIQVEEIETIVHLQGIRCKMKWVAPLEELYYSLIKDPPVIWLQCLSEGKAVPFACGIPNMELLTKEQNTFYSTVRFQNPVSDMNYGEMLVSVTANDPVPCEQENDLKNPLLEKDASPPVMDTDIALKAVKELEEWKAKQEELFKAELKKKEIVHLDALTAEWERQQKESESVLKNNIEHCSKLTESLNRTTEELKAKSQDLAHKERELKDLEKTLQKEYLVRVQELREASRRMQDDHNLKISQLELEKDQLKERIDVLQKENENLKNKLKIQDKHLERLRKATLTEEQTASLLQELKSLEEKYEVALRSKAFFKEQWLDSVREIHQIKAQHHEALKMQFKQNREELQNLSLQKRMNGNHTDMDTGAIILRHISCELKKTLDQDKPSDNPILQCTDVDEPALQLASVDKPALESDLGCQENSQQSKSTSSLPENKDLESNPKFSNDDDDPEVRLQRLIEERDNLLYTGTYTLESTAIRKLNEEIRQLLIPPCSEEH